MPFYITLGRTPPRWLRVGGWCAVALWAATIWWFSSRTGEEIEEMNIFKLSDKVAHFVAFFAGTPALFCALRWSSNWSLRSTIIACALVFAAYGAGDEYHQTFTANRTGADKWDWAGDALGGLSGTLACAFMYVRLNRTEFSDSPAPAGD